MCIILDAISEAEEKYACKVEAVVTDNEAKMAKMRDELKRDDPNLTVYGYSAHYLNLLGGDITINTIERQVTEVNKFFRNHHRPTSLLTVMAHLNQLFHVQHAGIASWTASTPT